MKNDYSVYWEGVKKELKEIKPQSKIHIFIDRIEYTNFNIETNIMKLLAPSNFIKDHILKYKEDIETALSNVYGKTCIIEIIVSHHQKEKEKEFSPPPKTTKAQIHEVKENNSTNKIEDYSFESFIIGSSNEFAAKAAIAVAENPGSKYNPYFIWGESGIGKTHLLKAIEKHVKEHFPSKKVKYVTSEQFTNDFVNSLSSKKMEQFRIKYRNLDVLLVDDVQFFANKDTIQIEIFNTFNDLYDDFKQMVFSCDQPIYKVKKMEERLKNRFAMGLVVDLKPADFELRMAILKFLAGKFNLEMEFKAMEYICNNIGGNIRDIKGACQLLVAYTSIMKKPITLEVAKEKLKDKFLELHSTPISVDKIIQIVAEYNNLKYHELIGTKKTQSIVLSRQIAMYICRKITRLSTTQIGKYFGDKEHGTVMHATKKVEELMENDIKIKKDVEILINQIKAD